VRIKLAHWGFYARPAFLGIGAQKAGTTALYKYLSQHPSLKPSVVKEVDYFNCESRYSLGVDFYNSNFPPKLFLRSGQNTFEVTPAYLHNSKAPKRIYDYNPNIKLIALLRDPIMRAFSAWQMNRKRYRENKDWFFDWMRRCDRDIKRDDFVLRTQSYGENWYTDIVQELAALEQGRRIEMPTLAHGLYAEHLKDFFSYFSVEDIFVVNSERFLAKTSAVLQEIEQFLGLPGHTWDVERLRPVHVGNYDEVLPRDAKDALAVFYHSPNQALYSLLGREFDWIQKN
jgi:hypothetical protein